MMGWIVRARPATQVGRVITLLVWLASVGPFGMAKAADDLLLPKHATGGPMVEQSAPPLQIRDLLTERQDDAIEARALFMQGRLLLDRRQFADALHCYERAWRFDPLLVSLIHDVVPLAVSLNRDAEATRYAIIAAEQENDVPPALIQRVADILASRLEFQRALGIYQRFVRRPPKNATPLARTVALLNIGRLSVVTQEFAQAAKAFDEARTALKQTGPDKISAPQRKKLLPNEPAAYALMAEAYLRVGRLKDAEAMFRRANQAKPNDGLLAYQLARVAEARGDRATARSQLDKYFAAKLSSAGLLPYRLLARLLTPKPAASKPSSGPPKEADSNNAARGKPTPALLRKLELLVQADPDNAVLGYFYADQLRRARQWSAAESQYRKLLEYEPSAEAFQGLVAIYAEQHDATALLKTISQVVLQTSSLDSLDDYADQLAANQKLLAELTARVPTADVDKKRPVPDGALRACALLQLRAKHYDAATDLFHRAMRKSIPRRGPFAIEFALRMMADGQPKPAVDALRQVIDRKLMPGKEAELYHALAGAYALDHQFDAALDAARMAANKAPDSSRMAARVGWVYYYAKQLDQARTHFLTVLDRFDDDYRSEENRAVMRDLRQMLASICVDQERPQDAESWLLQVLDEYPEDTGAYNDLGYLWCDEGLHLNRSFAMIRKAVAAEPDNIAFRDSLGWALFRLGRFRQAIRELEKAASSPTADGVILDHLGDAYSGAGRRDKAIEAWKKAIARLRKAGETDKAATIAAKLGRVQK